MIIAFAGNDAILPTRLAKCFPGGCRTPTRMIWRSEVSGKMLYIHVMNTAAMANFCVSDCNWIKFDDKGWYKGEVV